MIRINGSVTTIYPLVALDMSFDGGTVYLTQMGRNEMRPVWRGCYRGFRRRGRLVDDRVCFFRSAFFTASSQSPSILRVSGAGPRGLGSFCSAMLPPIFGARVPSSMRSAGFEPARACAHVPSKGSASASFATTAGGREHRGLVAVVAAAAGCHRDPHPAQLRRPQHTEAAVFRSRQRLGFELLGRRTKSLRQLVFVTLAVANDHAAPLVQVIGIGTDLFGVPHQAADDTTERPAIRVTELLEQLLICQRVVSIQQGVNELALGRRNLAVESLHSLFRPPRVAQRPRPIRGLSGIKSLGCRLARQLDGVGGAFALHRDAVDNHRVRHWLTPSSRMASTYEARGSMSSKVPKHFANDP